MAELGRLDVSCITGLVSQVHLFIVFTYSSLFMCHVSYGTYFRKETFWKPGAKVVYKILGFVFPQQLINVYPV